MCIDQWFNSCLSWSLWFFCNYFFSILPFLLTLTHYLPFIFCRHLIFCVVLQGYDLLISVSYLCWYNHDWLKDVGNRMTMSRLMLQQWQWQLIKWLQLVKRWSVERSNLLIVSLSAIFWSTKYKSQWLTTLEMTLSINV